MSEKEREGKKIRSESELMVSVKLVWVRKRERKMERV
jgi:hypothetical protein